MLKRSRIILSCLYVVAAIAFRSFIEFREPFSTVNVVTIGHVVGGAAALLAISAVVPVIIWGTSKLVSRPIGFPVIVWIALGVGSAYLFELGNRAARDQRIGAFELTDKDRTEFQIGAKQGCMNSQRQNDINRKAGVTDEQINTYCTCYADAIGKAITLDELRHAAANGKQADSVQEKAIQIHTGCINVLLQK
jgi:hypothetical protein